MRNCKKILIIFMIITIIMPICLTLKVYATKGDALITSESIEDKDGYSTALNYISGNKFIDHHKNYFNIYCVDGGRNRPSNTDDRKITDEKYITNYMKINNDIKDEIFTDNNQYNMMLWLADNMYLWQYDETTLSETEIVNLKKKNIEEIKKIIIEKLDYLNEEQKLNINEEFINSMFDDIVFDDISNLYYKNIFHEDFLVNINKALVWKLVKHTKSNYTEKYINLVDNHITSDGNILCLYYIPEEGDEGYDDYIGGGLESLEHVDIYSSSEENKKLQKILKAYYFAMLKTAQDNSNYSIPNEMTIDESKAITNTDENKIGPFIFNNYNKKYIKEYTLTINKNEVSEDLYKIEVSENGEFYISFNKIIFEKAGDYHVELEITYDYGKERDIYIITDESSDVQPVLAVNYNDSIIKNTIIDDITIREKLVEPEQPEYPIIKVTKTADKTVVLEGDKVTYTILVENVGNVDLTNILVTDEMLNINKTIEKLEVGKSETITGTYILTKDDINNEKEIINTATVTTQYKDKKILESATATIVPKIIIKEEIETEVEVEKEFPILKVTKTADKTVVAEGDEVTYTITVENIGNVDLENVVVKDEMLGLNKTIEKLEAGKSEILTGTYNVTKNDVEKEDEITNTVTVTTKYKDKQLLESATATIVPKIVKKEQVTVEVEKEVIKVVEKEVPIEVEKVVEKEIYVQKDSTTATTTIPKAGSKYIIIFISSIMIISVCSYIFYKKNRIK